MLAAVTRTYRQLNAALVRLVGYLVFMIMVLVTVDVVLRYVFLAPLSWTVEVSEYLLVAIAFLPACHVLFIGMHIEVDVFVERLSSEMRARTNIVKHVLGLIYCGILTWQSGKLAIRAYLGNWRSESGTDFILFPVYSLVPVGGFLLTLGLLVLLLEQVVNLKKGSPIVNEPPLL